MKKIFLFTLVLLIISCKNKKDNTSTTEENTTISTEVVEDNAELIEIYTQDQADRKVDKIDWSVVSENDRKREKRIYEMLDAGLVKTSRDYHNAAMIFQHGMDSTAYRMAKELMTKSVELDPLADKWLLAAATDRYLLSIDKPQIYGTQYFRKDDDDPWQISEMDTTQITDEERLEYRVGTLTDQRERLKRMNQKKISEKMAELKSIDQLIDFIKKEDLNSSKYDFSEMSVNRFGYELMEEENNQDALKIFKLNTELYPNAYNTHDSYGECLLKLGDKENGIKAYKKSLELNPENEGAAKIISEHEAQ